MIIMNSIAKNQNHAQIIPNSKRKYMLLN
jgi:hypothetical protein